MLPRFRVFHHSPSRPRQIIVQQLDADDFKVSAGSLLAGHPIKPLVSQPRALDDSGQPRTDLFVFSFDGPKVPTTLAEGEVVFLETPNQRCSACAAEWTEPPLSSECLLELRELLDRDQRISFVRRLREMSGIGLASAKAILDHTDFHVAHCHRCDALIGQDLRVLCTGCGALTYPWHSPDWSPPARRRQSE